jgi:hypothetical protein
MERTPNQHEIHPLKPCFEAIYRRDCSLFLSELNDAWKRGNIETFSKLIKVFNMCHDMERDSESKLIFFRKDVWSDDKQVLLKKTARRII